MSEQTNAVVIGYGYWGRNIARNVHENLNLNLVAIFDLEFNNRLNASRTYPHVLALENISKFGLTADDMYLYVHRPRHTLVF